MPLDDKPQIRLTPRGDEWEAESLAAAALVFTRAGYFENAPSPATADGVEDALRRLESHLTFASSRPAISEDNLQRLRNTLDDARRAIARTQMRQRHSGRTQKAISAAATAYLLFFASSAAFTLTFRLVFVTGAAACAFFAAFADPGLLTTRCADLLALLQSVFNGLKSPSRFA